MVGVPGTVGPDTDLVQRRVDMGLKSTNGRGTVTGLTQRTEEGDAMDPQQCTAINNAMSDVLVCTLSLEENNVMDHPLCTHISNAMSENVLLVCILSLSLINGKP